MEEKKFLLNLKSLLWCVYKYKDRYNMRLILDSFQARHAPESIQNTHLGQNVSRILYELRDARSLKPLIDAIRRLPKSRESLCIDGREFRIGQYVIMASKASGKPAGAQGVISFLDGGIRGLFYDREKGLTEIRLSPETIKRIPGAVIQDCCNG